MKNGKINKLEAEEVKLRSEIAKPKVERKKASAKASTATKRVTNKKASTTEKNELKK